MKTSTTTRPAESRELAPAVTVYTAGPGCPQCQATLRRLRESGIPAREVDLRLNEPAREFVTEELGYSQAPVIIVDPEPHNHWSGFRPDLIDRLVAGASS